MSRTDENDDDLQLSLVSNENGILKYQDIAHFQRVMEILNKRREMYQDDFFAQNSNISDSQLEQMIQNGQFNENAPLIAFENSKNFQSQGKLHRDSIGRWIAQSTNASDLNNSILATKTIDFVLGTMINDARQYKIGNTIFQADYITQQTSADLCISTATDIDVISYNNGTRKGVTTMTLVSLAGGASYVKTEATHYKKLALGWLPWKTNILVTHDVMAKSINCGELGSLIKSKEKYALTLQVISWGLFPQTIFQKVGTTDAQGAGVFNYVNWAVANW